MEENRTRLDVFKRVHGGLWKGERAYIRDIEETLLGAGYT